MFRGTHRAYCWRIRDRAAFLDYLDQCAHEAARLRPSMMMYTSGRRNWLSLAKFCGIPRARFYDYRAGTRKDLEYETFQRLAKGVELFSDEKAMELHMQLYSALEGPPRPQNEARVWAGGRRPRGHRDLTDADRTEIEALVWWDGPVRRVPDIAQIIGLAPAARLERGDLPALGADVWKLLQRTTVAVTERQFAAIGALTPTLDQPDGPFGWSTIDGRDAWYERDGRRVIDVTFFVNPKAPANARGRRHKDRKGRGP